ncbi:hypothetical protein GGQ80_002083 [Sphingomonas jinjuensis]|uniref:Uncharacterized protein n=1 Tax=Sphingomonas jinjuensis TaxID=535907 RepID=A0A840F4D3_9SPHN|nr:hypothetical protein [Sphingomonas jinjuensis]MBB4154173.1 hypothetical protein [Sphingomonas jinjuensis]
MPNIVLIGAAPIRGVTRFPSEGPQMVSRADAKRLIRVGLAQPDDLDTRTIDEVRAVAQAERVDIGPNAVKADTVAAIRARRALER